MNKKHLKGWIDCHDTYVQKCFRMEQLCGPLGLAITVDQITGPANDQSFQFTFSGDEVSLLRFKEQAQKEFGQDVHFLGIED